MAALHNLQSYPVKTREENVFKCTDGNIADLLFAFFFVKGQTNP